MKSTAIKSSRITKKKKNMSPQSWKETKSRQPKRNESLEYWRLWKGSFQRKVTTTNSKTEHNQNVNCCGGQWPSLHSQCRIPLARFSKKPCQRLRCQMRQEARTQIPFTELVTTHEAPQTCQFDVSKIETTVEKPASTTILQWIGLQSLSCHQFQPPRSRLEKKWCYGLVCVIFSFLPCPLMTAQASTLRTTKHYTGQEKDGCRNWLLHSNPLPTLSITKKDETAFTKASSYFVIPHTTSVANTGVLLWRK